jgi:3-dehydroquinate dehydratase/shikimate dehydrogenase
MLCITASANTSAELLQLLKTASKQLEDGRENYLLEFRLDSVDHISVDLRAYIAQQAHRAIICLRSKNAGGSFDRSEQERIEILNSLLILKPAWVDLEVDTDFEKLTHGNTKRIVSVHRFSGTLEAFSDAIRGLDQKGFDAIKGAMLLTDTAENQTLLELAQSLKTPHVVIGMGEAGLVSRLRYRHFGSLWTYASASETTATAAGQPSLKRALEFGLPRSADHSFIALLGDERIRYSKGPYVYNRLFRKKNLPWSYIPMPTNSPKKTLELAQKLGAIGASVTIPHKETLAHEIPCDNKAKIGATNTIAIRPNSTMLASNTDIEGFSVPLTRARVSKNWKCLILGAGGAAQAAVEACRQLELIPIIAARNMEKSMEKHKNILVIPWEKRTDVEAEVLINTTPLGGQDPSVWPTNHPLNKILVFDCAVSPEESLLLKRAREEGARSISPLEMWAVQGVRQMHTILGIAFEEEDLINECSNR